MDLLIYICCCCCSVAKSCLTPCNPMDCSTPGFPVLHYLLHFAQTHVHWAVTSSNHLILCHHLLLLPSILPIIRIFSSESALQSGGQGIGSSASASVLPVNIQGWFPLWLTGPCSPRESHKSSTTPQLESINSSVFSLLYGPNSLKLMTPGKTIASTIQTFVGKVTSLLFNTLSRFFNVYTYT